ncbi:hypothetical protein CTAM01_05835 [Colletotrichum tamarilloi]|uniref:Uncharacterized protein n=1 Tax=Colletotrichum tamarilloi TaxID=1209934 RepID=A0ABQ9RE51_9PEZI|nr:uncharacterized protein CTAM01_05835 [Colletotrichum tamarilloi]KAK1501611.1 hypothetical protein CTAM01_05835 [Colletotrichum tamarilloi]
MCETVPTLPLVVLLLLHNTYTQGGPPKSPSKTTQTGKARTRPLVSWEGREDVFLRSGWLGEFWQSVIGWMNEKRRITTTLPLAPGRLEMLAALRMPRVPPSCVPGVPNEEAPRDSGNNKNTTITFNPPLTVPLAARSTWSSQFLYMQRTTPLPATAIPTRHRAEVRALSDEKDGMLELQTKNPKTQRCNTASETCSTRNVDPSRVKQTSKEAETKHLNVRAPKLARARLSDLTLPSLHGSRTPLQPPSPEDPYAWYTTALDASQFFGIDAHTHTQTYWAPESYYVHDGTKCRFSGSTNVISPSPDPTKERMYTTYLDSFALFWTVSGFTS